jgi:hypothetical protein
LIDTFSEMVAMVIVSHEFAEEDVGHVMGKTDGEPDVRPFFGNNVDGDPLRGEGDGKKLGCGVEEVDYGWGVKDGITADGDGSGGLDLEGCVVYKTEFEGCVWERSVFSDEMVHCLLSVAMRGRGGGGLLP